MRAICVAGARPNLMKIKPVIDALEAVDVEVVFVHTGQHYDDAMSGVFHEDLGLRQPDRFLGVGSGTHAVQTARVMTEFEPVLGDVRPDVVIVVGDVNSTVGCALVAAKAGPFVAHVEAGLRSRDWSMPEEVNRLATDRLSDYLFSPSPDAADNLRAEGYRADQIHLVGNVMVDTLLANVDRAMARPILDELAVSKEDYGLVTLHRPATVDDPTVLAGIIATLGRIARDVRLVFPVHPRTRRALDPSTLPAGIMLTDPLGYLDFICLEAQARLVLTDSGGVQEETTVLGTPCLTLRTSTERPITVTQGTNQIVGHDPSRILRAASDILASGYPARRPALWDGQASQRIAAVLVDDAAYRTLRPSDLAPAD